MTHTVQLSKWWQTKSCQAAYERANLKRAERIANLQKQVAERRAQLERDVQNWKEPA